MQHFVDRMTKKQDWLIRQICGAQYLITTSRITFSWAHFVIMIWMKKLQNYWIKWRNSMEHTFWNETSNNSNHSHPMGCLPSLLVVIPHTLILIVCQVLLANDICCHLDVLNIIGYKNSYCPLWFSCHQNGMTFDYSITNS